MLNRVRKTIAAHAMLEQGDRLLVAVSGGPDSVALLRILSILADEHHWHLTAAHLNHGLRSGESDEEAEFVRHLSAGMGIACVVGTVDIRALRDKEGGSLEEAGRKARYRFFEETAQRCGADRIAVGHHRDDQAETVLLHLLRGTGPEGLRGMLPVRDGRIIRPLLEVGRSDILAFLKAEGLSYRTDSSNDSLRFLRNRIRKELLPMLAETYNPRLIEGLCQTAGIIRREDGYLQEVVDRTLLSLGGDPGREENELPVDGLLGQHEAIQGRVVKRLLEAASPLQNGIAHRHIEAVLATVRRPAGRRTSLDLPFGIRVEREGGILRIRREARRGRRQAVAMPPCFEYPVGIPAEIRLRDIGRTVRLKRIERPGLREMKGQPDVAFMDEARIIPPLVLRNMRPGDRVALLGTGGTKKLKDYFIDRRIAVARRAAIPLLADAQSIVWVAGERIAERVRVTRRTKTVLKAEFVASVEPSEII